MTNPVTFQVFINFERLYLVEQVLCFWLQFQATTVNKPSQVSN